MKVQILISKSSWANYYKKKILNKLKRYSNNIILLNSHKKLKKNYDINIIFSYFKKILSFEILSSTDWALYGEKQFQPNYFIDISKHIKNKIDLIKFYKEELRNYPHSRSINAIKALASVRGVSCGVKYAEGFYLNRFID